MAGHGRLADLAEIPAAGARGLRRGRGSGATRGTPDRPAAGAGTDPGRRRLARSPADPRYRRVPEGCERGPYGDRQLAAGDRSGRVPVGLPAREAPRDQTGGVPAQKTVVVHGPGCPQTADIAAWLDAGLEQPGAVPAEDAGGAATRSAAI